MRASTRVDYERRVGRAQRHLEARLDVDVRPQELARVASMSLHHFHRVFRVVTGESLMEHRRRLRLERAALTLRRTDREVLEVAFDAGYQSHEAFTRAFADHFGAPPSRWRQAPSARVTEAERADRPLPDPTLRVEPDRTYLHRRHVGGFEQSAEAWARWYADMGARGLLQHVEAVVGRYPDDPDITPAEHIRFDVGGFLPHDIVPPPSMSCTTVPGGTWAVATHVGPYSGLSEVYVDLVRWCVRRGRGLGDRPCLEVYRNTPMDVAPEGLITEVWAPLA